MAQIIDLKNPSAARAETNDAAISLNKELFRKKEELIYYVSGLLHDTTPNQENADGLIEAAYLTLNEIERLIEIIKSNS